MEGWIKLHRKMIDWEWYKDSNTFHLFAHLLFSANYKKTKWRGIEIERGQLLTGRDQLSANTGISTQSIRTSLERLKSTNEITIKSTSKFSIITICNYDKYQDDEKPINQQSNQQSNQQLTSNQPATNHIQESKEGKELKEGKKKDTTSSLQASFDVFYTAYPKHKAKDSAIKAWKKLNPEASLLQTILRAIEVAKDTDSWKKDNGTYIPLPATWLNGKRWEDEVQTHTTTVQETQLLPTDVLKWCEYLDTITDDHGICIQKGKESIVAALISNRDYPYYKESPRTSEQWERLVLEKAHTYPATVASL